MRQPRLPDEIAADAELEGIYLDSLESVLNGSNPGPDGIWYTADDTHCAEGSEETACQAAPIPRAMNAFQFCLVLATRVRWFSEWSQVCEVALNELAPADFPLAAEIRGVPGYLQDVLASPGAVELRPHEEAEDDSGTGDSAVTGGRHGVAARRQLTSRPSALTSTGDPTASSLASLGRHRRGLGTSRRR